MTQIKQSYSAEDTLDDLNALMYIIRGQIENSVNTIDIVRVLNVNDDNTIDVIPVIKDINASREPIDEAPIYGVRYIRFQYGQNAITVAPKVNDVGLLLVCKKDISAYDSGMVATKIKYNPTNGIYLGGLCGANQTPTQYIHFEDDKIDIVGTGVININAPTVNVNATDTTITSTNTTVSTTSASVTADTVSVSATTSATVTTAKAVIDCANINLGGEGGKKIALDGDSVVRGKVVASSTTTSSL